jgi:tRNA wybutosine-synthesizing protein 3
MVYNFENSKQSILQKKDKSSIGSWDAPIAKLCDKLNKHPDYYTTSSCSGRIVLIIEKLEKGPGLFLFRSHEMVSLEELKKELQEACLKTKDIVYLKQEPCVLAVSCSSVENAQELVDLARRLGWKRAGITTTTKKNIVELFGTEKLELPIIDGGRLLVDEEYLKILVKEANIRLKRTWEKIKKLEKEF